MLFNPAIASKNIKDDYIDYITTTFSFADKKYQALLKNELLKGLDGINGISKGPIVDVKDIFEASGDTINTLIEKGILVSKFRDLEKNKIFDGRLYRQKLPLDRPLYNHQLKAIEILVKNGRNAVITTGTGSGKTECFLIPIINSLLLEKVQSTLISPGIRAILIYPMNALANDQMKRLREILMKYDDITFGVYNGDTRKTYKEALSVYQDLHRNEDCKELQKPLKNELISREQMQSTPPHILCTNYAMLEHMLLRPDNDMLFSNADYKFVVLDEAHIYSGTTGMETAMLLRRLRARIKAKGKTQYILTSATLGQEGESERNIVKFANNLTGEVFSSEDVVFGKRVREDLDSISNVNIDISVFTEIATKENRDEIHEVFTKHGILYNDILSVEENIYDLCKHSLLYKRFRQLKLGEMSLSINDYAKKLNLTEEQVIQFIFVCTISDKGGKALIDARYHFFIRALEGIYGNLLGNRRLYLDRKIADENENTCFEFGLCRTCGDMSIVGKIVEDDKLEKLEQAKRYEDKRQPIRYFHILSSDEINNEGHNEEFEDDELDETIDDEEVESDRKKSIEHIDYFLCCKCGAISVQDDGKPMCPCDKQHSILVREFKDNQEKCVKCQSGKYSRFYLGNEAATAVLATSLFEELPAKTIVERVEEIDYEREGGKQFLAFSDSRSEAAFFASYLSKSYKEFLRRRGLIYIINKNREEMVNETWDLETLAEELAKHFKKKQSFKENLSCIQSDRGIRKLATKNAWIAVLSELVNARRRTSLVSLGYIKFEYAGNTRKVIDFFSKKYLIDLKVCKSLLDEIAMSFAYFGAIDFPDESELDEDDRKYIFYTSKQKAITEIRNSDTNKIYMSFLARNREGKDTFYKNVRQKLVMDAIGVDGIKSNAFLSEYFNEVLINAKNEYKAIRGAGDFYFMPAKNYIVRVKGDPDAKWYRCSKCHRVTTSNINNECNTYGCDGKLDEVDADNIFSGNHYIASYNKDFFTPLIMKEHTAQLSREEGQKYQDDFTKNLIHALSCSTTFEMGVDVGDLETVFLRNVPPTSANYAQRAGRAGRSKNIAAYALTYAKLSSHDFNYFKNPGSIINGEMRPPLFKTNNKKIVLRHIYAVVLSSFFREYKEYFNENKATEFLENDGLEMLRAFIDKKPQTLTDVLSKSFGQELNDQFGITLYKWTEDFIGETGVMTKLIKDYQETVREFEIVYKEQIYEDTEKSIKKAGAIKYQLRLYKTKQMIEFLSRGNVLPRYGFPVDTVELTIAKKDEKMKELQLTRDLKLAISEYAPGEKIVANDKLYVSRYIKKSIFSGNVDFYRSYVCLCETCGTWNFRRVPVGQTENKIECINCKAPLPAVNWMEAIEPRDGFITDGEEAREVPMRRPDKIYVNEESYIGDQKEIKKYKFTSNANALIFCSTENDEILVTSKTKFYVCKYCGYTYGVLDKIKDDTGKKDTKAMKGIFANHVTIVTKKKHRTSKGGLCPDTTLHREILNHTFKTDVVTIEFVNKHYSKEVVLSAMYAILNAMSIQLNIERADISGCVKYALSGDGQSYSIVLYDAVAGGAGYVRTLIGDRGATLTRVFRAARKSMECNCDTSCYACLRSYQNQRHHDELDRKLAIHLLDDYLNEIIFIEEIIPKTNSSLVIVVKENTGLNLVSLSKQTIWKQISDEIVNPEEKDKLMNIIKLLVGINYQKPDYSDVVLSVNGEDKIVDLIWIAKKIILCSSFNGDTYENIKGDSEWNVFYIDTLDINEFIHALEE